MIRSAGIRPRCPVTSRESIGLWPRLTSKTFSPKALTIFLRIDRADAAAYHPRAQILLEPHRSNSARVPGPAPLNRPTVGPIVDRFDRDAVIRSPAEMLAAWPTTVTRSRCPRALARSTQEPLSALRKVTRSTRPARTSRVDDIRRRPPRRRSRIAGSLFARDSADAGAGGPGRGPAGVHVERT